MRSQILGVCAVLAASLATSAFGQIQRSAISKNRVFGVQTLLPAPICDDRDLAGTIRTKLQFKPLTPPGQPVKVDMLFTSAQGDPDMQVSIDLPRPLRLASGASTARSRVTEDGVFRSSWSIQPSVYGRYPITMRLEPSQGQPAQTVRLYMDVYQEGVFLTQGAPYQTYQELTRSRQGSSTRSDASSEGVRSRHCHRHHLHLGWLGRMVNCRRDINVLGLLDRQHVDHPLERLHQR